MSADAFFMVRDELAFWLMKPDFPWTKWDFSWWTLCLVVISWIGWWNRFSAEQLEI